MKLKTLALLTMATYSLTSYAAIEQARGVDQRVDYKSLEKYGAWDDRNYLVTKEDLALIPAKDQYLANVPVFFKVFKRKEMPHLGEFYPRATLQQFYILHGGLIVDGVWHKESMGVGYHANVTEPGKFQGVEVKEIRGGAGIAESETAFEVGVNGNETSVECNPLDNTRCVAGSNASGGQAMYFSSDSGVTWTKSQTNPSSCCDPVVDWSSDGSIVYQADLSSAIGVRWTRSLDQGETWEPMKVITPSGSDKEWLHVDRSNSSVHKDNVYMTWHDGNVMQFSRSTDMGQTMSTPLAFGGEETGIGSDITTDSAGNVYYVYPGLQGGGIRLLKSTDGGLTFNPSVQVSPINGRFDFPVPSMESREVFIYVSVDVDSNDNIYVAFTDEADDSTGGGTGSAATNHAVVKVAKSTDGGATWNDLPIPHDTSDSLANNDAVDRYHPWLMVDEFDNVHIAFYDTRQFNDRSGVDFYYNASTDGGASWNGEQRISTQSSGNLNDGQEWGDYNSLSVVMDKIVMSWTDNRTGKVGMAGTLGNAFGEPTFNLSATPSTFDVCADDSGLLSVIDVSTIQGYAGVVTLTVEASPPFVNNTAFSSNNQSGDFSSNLTFDIGNLGVATTDVITVQGSGLEMGETILKSTDITVNYSPAEPGATTLTAPADNATGVTGGGTVYNWNAITGATSYTIEISDDAGFANIIETETVNTNSYVGTVTLASDTEHFWRVSATNSCGDGVASTASSFTTSNELCFAFGTGIPDNDPAGLTVTGNVTDQGSIDSITVSTEVTHTWVGDLIFTLSHDGTDVVLMDRPGVPAGQFGCGGDNVDATFDDASGVVVETVCDNLPAIGGTVQPLQAVSAFVGSDIAGDWSLSISDNAGQDTGQIDQFCLLVETSPVVDTCDEPSPVGDPEIIFRDGFECIQQQP